MLAPAISEEEVAEQFSALVVPFSRGDLASAAERSKAAAKHWKAGSRAPNSSSLITLARRVGVIRDWVIEQIDMPEAQVSENPNDTLATVMLGLQLAANLPGQEGAVAKMLLSKMQRGG